MECLEIQVPAYIREQIDGGSQFVVGNCRRTKMRVAQLDEGQRGVD